MPLAHAPGRVPVLGHLPAYVRDPLGFLVRASRMGRIVEIDFAGRRSYVVSEPELIEEVLVARHRSFGKDMYLRDLKRVLGEGLLTSEGDFWRRQRRLAQPAFHREKIAGYARTMVENTERAIATWRPGEVRDVYRDMMALTLEIAGKTLFGADVGTEAKAVGEALEAVLARYADPVAMTVPHWDRLPTPQNRRFEAGVRRLDGIVRGLIRSHREGRTGDGRDLLSMLLAARDEDGSGMSDDQLRDEVLTIILAGHETTAIALSWTFVLLDRNPHVAAALGAELDRVLGGRAPGLDDLPSLAFVDRIVRESMRLQPPAWSIGREALEELELDDLRLVRGDNVWIPQWAVHRDPRFFPDPERFDPDRWSGDLAKRLPKFAYFPFGGGPRICIGNTFAMMEAVLCLATIAQRFRLHLVPGHPIGYLPSVTLRPKHGVRVRLAARPAREAAPEAARESARAPI